MKNITNIHIEGNSNVVSVHQAISNESGAALAMVFKFLLTVLLLPIALPVLLATHAYRMLMEADHG